MTELIDLVLLLVKFGQIVHPNLLHSPAAYVLVEGLGQSGEQSVLVQRVVNQQGLLLIGRVCELSSHEAVSQGDAQSIEDIHHSSRADEDSS